VGEIRSLRSQGRPKRKEVHLRLTVLFYMRGGRCPRGRTGIFPRRYPRVARRRKRGRDSAFERISVSYKCGGDIALGKDEAVKTNAFLECLRDLESGGGRP